MAILVVAALGYAWFHHDTKTSNPHSYKTIGEIPVPYGYERVDGSDAVSPLAAAERERGDGDASLR